MRQLLLCLFFLAAGSSVCAQTANLDEELLAATRKSDVAGVKALLAKGANVNAKTAHGATPIFYACDRGNAEVVKILLDAGAEIYIQDPLFKTTPLMFAILRDHAEIVTLLLEKMPGNRESAMTQAVRWDRVKTAGALLGGESFKPEFLNYWLTLAETNHSAEMIESLKKAGAKPKPKPEFKIEPEKLKLYEGAFENEKLTASFKVKDGKLIGIVNGFVMTMKPVEEHTFESQEQPATVTFKLEGEKIVEVSLRGPGGETILKKSEAK